MFRGLRKRAARIDVPVKTRTGARARFRFLTPHDDEAFARLLASYASQYLPPHPLDRASAARALRRASYLPFGVFVEGRLVGYLLLVSSSRGASSPESGRSPRPTIWVSARPCLRQTAAFSRAEAVADYATIPIDNPNSVRMATAAGWNVIRTNRRFHVLLRG